MASGPTLSDQKGFMDEKQEILKDTFSFKETAPFVNSKKFWTGNSGAKNSGVHSQNTFRDVKTFGDISYLTIIQRPQAFFFPTQSTGDLAYSMQMQIIRDIKSYGKLLVTNSSRQVLISRHKFSYLQNWREDNWHQFHGYKEDIYIYIKWCRKPLEQLLTYTKYSISTSSNNGKCIPNFPIFKKKC